MHFPRLPLLKHLGLVFLLVLSLILPSTANALIDNDGDGYYVDSGPIDCDDTDPATYPGAAKICDGKDTNCDGKKDFSTDEDKDLDGIPLCGYDCDDNDPDRFPGNQEGPFGDATCSDTKDNDCDNKIDGADSQCLSPCLDEDNDGYGKFGDSSCPNPGIDCNDLNPNINPGMPDAICNGVDENCTGLADDQYNPTPESCGTGACSSAGQIECQLGILVNTCLPGTPQIETAFGEPLCGDNIDNDCDGLTDSDDSGCFPCSDNDGDGYGSNNDPSCQNFGIDCNDNNTSIHPGASDINCNGIDEDCSLTPDDGYVTAPTTCGLGICASTGQIECLNGEEIDTCIQGTSQTEGPVGDVSCGDLVDNDCDGLTDGIDSGCYDSDEDNDGDGYSPNQGDCDDTDTNSYPGALKICDGKDNNCDGKKDFSTDEDKDGDGVPVCANDCNDLDPLSSPNITEGPFGDPTCSDSIDNDCDRQIDSLDSTCKDPCLDKDGDGYGVNGHPTCPNGSEVDCDDSKKTINPGMFDDNCDNVDNNCSGTADDEYISSQTSCGTGACAAIGERSCQNGVEVNTCVSGSPQIEGPMGDVSCGDSSDNDCDGLADMTDSSCLTSCLDDDEDGYGENDDPSCQFSGFDCDDFNPDINPGMLDDNCDTIDNSCSGTPDDDYEIISTSCGTGACSSAGQMICQDGIEVDTCSPGSAAASDVTCDGIDDDCDGIMDEDYQTSVTNCGISICFSTGLMTCQGGNEVDTCVPGALLTEGPPGDPSCSDSLDNDCDGLTDSSDDACISVMSATSSDNDGDGFTVLDGDCNDNDNTMYPFAPKLCDGKDNNCDGKRDFTTDEDKDNDGVPWCRDDCDDDNPFIFPGNQEGPVGDPSCSDGFDNDCDRLTDLNDPLCNTPCLDNDGDGYGSNADPGCPNGPVFDCDDFNRDINPGAADTDCNNIDDNCSGVPDNEYVPVPTSCGIGACAAAGQIECQNGITIDTCFPGQPQPEGPLGVPMCSDSIDNDCDGFTDNNDFSCLSPCFDNDGDGYGSNGHVDCPRGPEIDCKDSDPDINPGIPDTTCNNIDENCSGAVDDEYVILPTSCGVGVCAATGQIECQNGTETDTCAVGIPGTEGPFTDATCSDSLDNDCDGYADNNDILDCGLPDVDDDNDGFSETTGDCDDSDPSVFPGAQKICDGKDNNCDGKKDFVTDEDKDNDGVPWCDGDCDDSNANSNPNLQEGPFDDLSCNDNIDNDCNGYTDMEDPSCAPPSCTTKHTPKDGPHIQSLMDPGIDLLDPSDDIVHPDNSILLCGKCHGSTLSNEIRQQCERCHSENGTFKLQYPMPWPYGFGSAQNVKLHSSTEVGTHYGNWDTRCVTCHNPHLQEQNAVNGTTYGKLIKEYICLDNPVTGLNIEEIIEFTAPSGPGSFADGPPNTRNICEMCHTQTNHHRRNGLAPGDFDASNNYIGHYDGEDCTECHVHNQGFKPSCNACHEGPPPTGTHIKHYGGSDEDAIYGGTGITQDIALFSPVYVINCGNCHPMDNENHMNGSLNSGGGDAEIELYNPAAPAGSLKSLNGPSATYVPGPDVFTDDRGFKYTQGTCNNVYCHSSTNVSTSGAVPLPDGSSYPLTYTPPWENLVIKTRQFQSPTWGVDSLGCNGCHGYPITTEFPTVSGGVGDSHAWIDDLGRLNLHVWNKAFGPLQCNTCHDETVQENFLWIEDASGFFVLDDISIFNTAKHANGTKDVAFSPIPILYPTSTKGDVFYDLGDATFDGQTKTCYTVPCHQSQTEVKWGSPFRIDNTAECNICHRY
jgi:predicted CxxxxCH...CXXCH cytochrome family protein